MISPIDKLEVYQMGRQIEVFVKAMLEDQTRLHEDICDQIAIDTVSEFYYAMRCCGALRDLGDQ